MTDIIAFDIDGALTKNEGMLRYTNATQMFDRVGIVSARSEDEIKTFIEENNIDPDFVKSAQLKGMVLRQLSRKYNPDKKVYVGSWPRDRMHALLAQWNYEEL